MQVDTSGRPIYRAVAGYAADQILGDARLVVESVLREKGLLVRGGRPSVSLLLNASSC